MKKLISIIAAISVIFSFSALSFAEEAPDEEALIDEAIRSEEPELTNEESTEAEEKEPVSEIENSSEPEEAPVVSLEWINLYIDNTLTNVDNRVLYINGSLYIPAYDTALLLSMNASYVPFSETVEGLCVSYGENSAYFFDDNCYAIINSQALDMELSCYNVDGVLYAPLEIFANVFNIENSLDTTGPDPDLYLTSFRSAEGAKYAERINSMALKSDTDYLIWVSKGSYSVRLFKKVSSSWVFDREFPCAIGAASSPTCEGVYKFYERVTAWKYTSYYVGPVMRFNKGYALHSTLVKYDGSLYDDRVGVKISHGCVRLHPDDINYLYSTIPLYTTVYVSAD